MEGLQGRSTFVGNPAAEHPLAVKSSIEFKAEHVATFYGINRTSYAVEAVTLSRGMVLTRWRGDAHPTIYQIRKGRPPLGQVARVFGLTDIVRVDRNADTPPWEEEHAQVVLLRILANQMKVDHAR